MVVFLVSGVWHAGLGYGVGWTFVIWGILNGFYQWAGMATRPFWQRIALASPRLAGGIGVRVLRILLTFHLILISWIFFRAESVAQTLTVIRKIATALPGLAALAPNYPFTADQAFGAALILLLIGIEMLDERRPIFKRLAAAPLAARWGAYYACLFGLLAFGRWQSEQFIYMQF